jgi:hypothetical protein
MDEVYGISSVEQPDSSNNISIFFRPLHKYIKVPHCDEYSTLRRNTIEKIRSEVLLEITHHELVLDSLSVIIDNL